MKLIFHRKKKEEKNLHFLAALTKFDIILFPNSLLKKGDIG
jgi:hypothetical protein